MGSHGWWDDCYAADKSKKYLFEEVKYDEKHSLIVGSRQNQNQLWLLLSELFQ